MLLDLGDLRRAKGISITPLIDVVFILLLFFMLSSTFSRTQQIELKAASTSAGGTTGEVQRLLLTPVGVELNGVVMLPESSQFEQKLQGISQQQQSVIVAGTDEISVQQLIRLVDQVRSAGISQLKIAQSVVR